MSDNPTGSKIYLQPEGLVFGTIADLAEMQKGKVTLSDSRQGKFSYSVNLYGTEREYCFSVTNIEKKRCAVKLEISEQEPDNDIMIQRQFALLDSMLTITAETLFAEQGKQDRD